MAALLLWGAVAAPADPRAYGGPDAVESRPASTTAEPSDRKSGAAGTTEPSAEPLDADRGMARTVTVEPRTPSSAEPRRASTVVTQKEIQERLPRSAPDALRFIPGVYVQQTAHAQASPYIRGVTGQQILTTFDGVRVNNSTFRQGPNQYLFTVDTHTIREMEVIRGSASTRYGSDALGGVILARPVEPSLDVGEGPVVVHPRAVFRSATADTELGGRAQIDLSYKGKLGLFGGVGYRDVGQLKSGGRFTEPATGDPQQSPPVFESDQKTQRGTGFREFTADARGVWKPSDKLRLTLGYYDYRQLDAPRTDKCPPPTAPLDECLTFEEQFRTLVYTALQGERGPAAAEDARWTVSYQNQHQRLRLDRGSPSATVLGGIDDVHTIGTGLQLKTKKFRLGRPATLHVRYGTDAYFDWIASEAWRTFEDVGDTMSLPRGQYTDDAKYLTSGAFAQTHLRLWDTLELRAGGRFVLAHANAPEGPQSTAEVNRTWVTGVGSGGIALDALPWLSLLFNVDQGYRAPNLDDLTSRQQTGPGYQFENASLRVEESVNVEGGFKIQHPWIELNAFVYNMWITDKIERDPKTVGECPPGAEGCTSAQNRFQLVNLPGDAIVRGAEGGVRLFFPYDLVAAAGIAYAWSEGPDTVDPEARRPLSRTPPLNGQAEAGWRSSRFGVYTIAAVRWATLQDRLSLGDEGDVRIPEGGTPGFAVVDLRAGYRMDPHLLIGLVFENVGDAAYRYHGSSINGPGRGVVVNFEVGW